VLRLYLVRAVQAGRRDRVQQFLEMYGEQLMGGADAAEWAPWFALQYLKRPHTDARFQVHGPMPTLRQTASAAAIELSCVPVLGRAGRSMLQEVETLCRVAKLSQLSGGG
jgi:hypothetical protein